MAYENVEWTGGDLVASTKLSQMVENTDIVRGGLIESSCAFAARRTSARNVGAGFTDIIPNTEDYDFGGDYDHTTGIFTAPVNGIYHFTMQMASGSASTVRAMVRIECSGNYSPQLQAYPDYETTQTRATICSVEGYMEAGATAKMQGWSTTTIDCSSDYKTFFSGHLVAIVT